MVDVTGGPASIAADCQDMQTTASLLGSVGLRICGEALELHTYLIDFGLLESAVLDPGGALSFETTLLDALDGPAGLGLLGARCLELQVSLAAAAQAYLTVDSDVRRLTPRYLPDFVLDRLTFGHLDALAGLLGQLYPDGEPTLTPLGVDAAGDDAGPPRDLAGLVAGLDRRGRGRPGEVDVRVLTGPGPVRHVVVDIPGTRDWSFDRHDADVANVGTNLRAMAGQTTTYERGVIEAMAAAGVRPGDDLTLVGHSLGGVIAVNTARTLAAAGGVTANRVITAGAPISGVVGRVPTSVQVLALENRHDVVPHADGAPNPGLGNVTTATFGRDHGEVGANHGISQSYLPGAREVQADDDRSIAAFLHDLQPTFEATSVVTSSYVVTRTVR